jgi:hypothetical protein
MRGIWDDHHMPILLTWIARLIVASLIRIGSIELRVYCAERNVINFNAGYVKF